MQSVGCKIFDAELRVQGVGCRVCRVEGEGCRVTKGALRQVQGSGLREQGVWCRVQDSARFRVQGLKGGAPRQRPHP